MGEEAEDVKPKIDLTINYEGQSQHFCSRGCGMGYSCGSGERSFSLAACTVKVKPTTPLKKVFEAAEVRALDPPS